MRFKALLLAVVTGVLAFGLGGTALAAKEKTTIENQQITHIPDDPFRSIYEGELKSDEKECTRNRRIQIFHKGVLIAKTRSNDKGNFRARGPRPPAGDEVTFKLLPDGDCKGDSVREFVLDD